MAPQGFRLTRTPRRVDNSIDGVGVLTACSLPPSMLFHIKHVTRYTYSRPVFCEPFTLRLRPREDAWQRLIRYQLSVDPPAAGMSEYLDAQGNCVTRCWFN